MKTTAGPPGPVRLPSHNLDDSAQKSTEWNSDVPWSGLSGESTSMARIICLRDSSEPLLQVMGSSRSTVMWVDILGSRALVCALCCAMYD